MIPSFRPFRLWRPLAGLLALALPAAAQDSASDTFALLVPFKKFLDAFNHQDPKLPADAFAARGTIVDSFAPYAWSGLGAAETWYERQVGVTAAEQKGFKAANEHLEIADPRFVRIDGTRAYFVIEATLSYANGDSGHRTIGLWTVSETKVGDHWLIENLSWGVLRAD